MYKLRVLYLLVVVVLGACGRVVTAPPMCTMEQVVRTVYSYSPAGDSIPALVVEQRCVSE